MTMEIPKEARKEAIASIERCWAISPGRRRQNLAAPTAWAKKNPPASAGQEVISGGDSKSLTAPCQ